MASDQNNLVNKKMYLHFPADLHSQITEFISEVTKMDAVIGALMPEEDRCKRIKEELQCASQRHSSGEPSALSGMLVGVKDLFRTNGLETRAGSKLPAECFSGKESSLVTKLKEKGAVILGKTTMDEFAYAAPSPAKNPWNIECTPGGSSSGSAAAVAAGYCPLALGTQTTRSIIAPASFCGVIGYKPSFGRLPLDGVVLLSDSLDTLGFLSVNMEVLQAACRELFADWKEAEFSLPLRLGIPQGKFMEFLYPETRKAFDSHIEKWRLQGVDFKMIEMPWEDEIEELYPKTLRLLSGEMAANHKEWLGRYHELYHPSTLKGVEYGLDVTAEDLCFLKEEQKRVRNLLHKVLEYEEVDAFICPSQAAPAPKGYNVTGYGGMTIPWSFAGLPCISLPVEYVGGMPLGIQLIGDFEGDEKLVQTAERLMELE